MTDYFEFGFLSGVIMAPWSPPYGSEMYVFVHNPTATEKTVRAIGYNASGQWFDSDTDFDPQAGPFDGKVPAHSVWIYPRRIYEDDPRIVWLSIWATSDQVVPSVQISGIVLGAQDIPVPVHHEWISPGDFAVKRNPFRLPRPEVVGPSDIGPVLNP